MRVKRFSKNVRFANSFAQSLMSTLQWFMHWIRDKRGKAQLQNATYRISSYKTIPRIIPAIIIIPSILIILFSENVMFSYKTRI